MDYDFKLTSSYLHCTDLDNAYKYMRKRERERDGIIISETAV
jgi:hypothetical protein